MARWSVGRVAPVRAGAARATLREVREADSRYLALVGVALLAALLSACAGVTELPDYQRGRAQLEAGDFAAAEADLRPLAEAGYVDAQQKLASLYAQMGTPQANQHAIHWYRVVLAEDPTVAVPLALALMRTGDPAVLKEAEASLRRADEDGDPRALAALIDFYTDHPDQAKPSEVAKMVKRAERLNAPETEGVVIRWYRHSTKTGGDPRHQAELIKRCEKALARQPDCYIDLARAYRAGNKTKALAELNERAIRHSEEGTLPARVLERYAWALIESDVAGEMQPEVAYKILKRANNNSPVSQVRLARLLVEHPYLDPAGNPEALLRSAMEQGSSEAALALGRLYMTGTRVAGDWAQAEQFLLKAAPTEPGAHYFLGRIYKRGALGRDDPVRAAQHYLTSARGGYVAADLALAQLFSDARGAKVNRVNAYVFARIATDNGVPRAGELLAQLKAAMSPAELSRAEKLWREELAARQTTDPTALAADGAQLRTENTQ